MKIFLICLAACCVGFSSFMSMGGSPNMAEKIALTDVDSLRLGANQVKYVYVQRDAINTNAYASQAVHGVCTIDAEPESTYRVEVTVIDANFSPIMFAKDTSEYQSEPLSVLAETGGKVYEAVITTSANCRQLQVRMHIDYPFGEHRYYEMVARWELID